MKAERNTYCPDLGLLLSTSVALRENKSINVLVWKTENNTNRNLFNIHKAYNSDKNTVLFQCPSWTFQGL